jgi:hypothetical protein
LTTRSWTRRLSARAPRTARKGAARFRPALETLKDRLAPASFTVLNTLDSGDGSLRAAVDAANAADGSNTITFATAARQALLDASERPAAPALVQAALWAAARAAGWTQSRAAAQWYDVRATATALRDAGASAAALADLVRCVAGNPLRRRPRGRPYEVPRNDTTLRLAQVAYDNHDWGLLPLLADALEEAGGAAREALAHLRGPGPHARGCWPVDLILGKS